MRPIGTFVPDFIVHIHLQQLSRKKKYTWLTIQFFTLQLQILFKIGSGVKKTKEEVKASSTGLSFFEKHHHKGLSRDRFIVCPKSLIE